MNSTSDVLQALGARELSILRAVLADEPICSTHPSSSARCSCGASAVSASWADAAEARRIESDDRDTGLTLEQREALLGWTLSQYAPVQHDGPAGAMLPEAAREIGEGGS